MAIHFASTNEIRNIAPRAQDSLILWSIFARTKEIAISEQDTSLPQQRKKINKWTQRSRVCIYLGISPKHTSMVHLNLSINTGNVLPPYHVDFNDYFKTTKWTDFMTKSEWQAAAIWGQLLGDFCTSGSLDHHQTDSDSFHHT